MHFPDKKSARTTQATEASSDFKSVNSNSIRKRRKKNLFTKPQLKDEKEEEIDSDIIDKASMQTRQYDVKSLPKSGQPGSSFNTNVRQSKGVQPKVANRKKEEKKEKISEKQENTFEKRAPTKTQTKSYNCQGGFEIQDTLGTVATIVLHPGVTTKTDRMYVLQALTSLLYLTSAAQLVHSTQQCKHLCKVLRPLTSRLQNLRQMFSAVTGVAEHFGDIDTTDGKILVENPTSTVFTFICQAFLRFDDIDVSVYQRDGVEIKECISAIKSSLRYGEFTETVLVDKPNKEEIFAFKTKALQTLINAQKALSDHDAQIRVLETNIQDDEALRELEVELLQHLRTKLEEDCKLAQEAYQSPAKVYRTTTEQGTMPRFIYAKDYTSVDEANYIGQTVYEEYQKVFLTPSLEDYNEMIEKEGITPYLFDEQKAAVDAFNNKEFSKIDGPMQQLCTLTAYAKQTPVFMRTPGQLINALQSLLNVTEDQLNMNLKKIDLKPGAFIPTTSGSTAQLFTVDESKVYFPTPLTKTAMLAGYGFQFARPGTVTYSNPVKCFRDDSEDILDHILLQDLKA